MNADAVGDPRSVSPASSERSSPVPHASRKVVEDGLYKADKSLRRYASIVERALASWEASPQEWADYIAFLSRLLKAIQSHPKDAPLLPHSAAVASKLAQCLNPTLPSGVHQKALEIYGYIFSMFGEGYLSDHLQEFLPGLSSVLSFASQSVRPGVYLLFEEYIVRLSSTDLRPPLKSLILSLLPAIEEETSEDFDRAFGIVEALERKFAHDGHDAPHSPEHGGYFWQCIFLCTITSPSRRQGALNYFTRRLPRFIALPSGASLKTPSNSVRNVLSQEAEAVISPEPGLLIRCFVAGLFDQQMLIQRGFLDLLVTNLPLKSPVLQEKIGEGDVDRLVSATIHVILRRDMSLNRRLWSWFLGTDPKDRAGGPQMSASLDQEQRSNGSHPPSEFQYFVTFGQTSLERCVLAMFRTPTRNAAEMARPFRICLSLMDRWEIGGSIVPQIFLPAIDNAYTYSMTASAVEVTELLRSASLFFDGVEASLIWANMNGLLRVAVDGQNSKADRLRLFIWVLEHFNVRDEEMVISHIPNAALYLLSLTNAKGPSSFSDSTWDLAMTAASLLVDLVPLRAFDTQSKVLHSNPPSDVTEFKRTSEDICDLIAEIYDERKETQKLALPFGVTSIAELLIDEVSKLAIRTLGESLRDRFCRTVPILLALISKWKAHKSPILDKLFQVIEAELDDVTGTSATIPFPTINAIVLLAVAAAASNHMSKARIMSLEPALTRQIWEYFSPSQTKYHVEAVRVLWQLEELTGPDENIKVSLLGLLRNSERTGASVEDARKDSARRFALLWNHTLMAQSASNRKGSAMPILSDAEHLAYRRQVLVEPLSLILDALNDPSDAAFDVVRGWLLALPSLAQIFDILLERLILIVNKASDSEPDSRVRERQVEERINQLHYVLTLIHNILVHGDEWTWQCLHGIQSPLGIRGEPTSGLLVVAQTCLRLLCHETHSSNVLNKRALSVLDIFSSGPAAVELRPLDLDVALIERLVECLKKEDDRLQGLLLQLLAKTIRLRLINAPPEPPSESRQGSSIGVKKPPVTSLRPAGNGASSSVAPIPPPGLLDCLRLCFSSNAVHGHMDHWLSFLASILPVFADAIFSNLIPLVECICAKLDKSFGELRRLAGPAVSNLEASPEVAIMNLMEALEMILARAHDCLLDELIPEHVPKPPTQPSSFFGNVASGVFKAEGPPSRTAQANSRLTVILAFQDAVRVSLRMWIWASHSAEAEDFDKASAATTGYSSLRVRNKSRQLLEQIFAVEPLEALEVVIGHWCHATTATEAGATVDLLQAMQGSRPKNVVPAVLDALCSRANPSALPLARQSSYTIDLTASDVASFLRVYLESTEDDAMDEVWSDCLAFLRDVLSNPLPYRQVLTILMSLILLLVQKTGNTNFGEQRKMRRELGDVFQRLLAATFTALPSGFSIEPSSGGPQRNGGDGGGMAERKRPTDIVTVLTEVVIHLDTILETSDRTTSSVNSISSHLIGPLFHAKSFPGNVTQESLGLLLEMAKRAPAAKSWRKEVTDAFYNAKLLASPAILMEAGWFPVFRQWSLRDPERINELLSRLTPPSTAGIMFGVGANAARLEADRRTQLNLRRICLLLLACPEDTYASQLREVQEKLVELFDASHSSSPSSAVKAELFMVCRALVLSTSGAALSPLWPVLNEHLQTALASLMPGAAPGGPAYTNLALLQAGKLLDQLVLLAPDEFQLHAWLYITDTIDAVYRPGGWRPWALSDRVADALSAGGVDDGPALVPLVPPSPSPGPAEAGTRRPLLTSEAMPVDPEDVKALAPEAFARTLLRPMLSQLSMAAYEGVYSLEGADTPACRRNLLDDVLDLGTVVE